MKKRFNINDALEQLNRGATLVTPNDRLSQQLMDFFIKKNPSIVQEKPRCVSYQLFVRQLFDEIRQHKPFVSHPLILSNLQEYFLWKKMLDDCNEGLLSEIIETWSRTQVWQLDINHPAFNDTPQTKRYRSVHLKFSEQLDSIHALTNAQLVNYILQHAKALITRKIIWVCFDEFNPQQHSLQDALFTHDYCDRVDSETIAYQLAASDQQEETNLLIDWLKQRLDSDDERIAVVVPDLQTQSQRLQRVLQRHISPELLNISLGVGLAEYPLVAHALAWLSLDTQSLSHHQIQLLLHSPYLYQAHTEALERAQTLQDSFLLEERRVPFKRLVNELNSRCPKLAATLQRIKPYPAKASVSEWIEQFKSRLSSLGFPGETPLNSSSYQCLQRFLQAIEELLQLAPLTNQLDSDLALELLKSWTQQIIFQPKKSPARIQLLGLLEASGCAFDSIWVCGLTDQCLPQSTRLSAFIPHALQREYKMPHALADRELTLAQQTLTRLQHGSQRCVFSYPKLIADIPQLPSPLLDNLASYAPISVDNPSLEPSLVVFDESYCLPFASDEIPQGGTALLSYQAQCPFRAFAAQRLSAKVNPSVSDGPNAPERGQVIHRVMETVWKELSSQLNLLKYDTDALTKLIEQAIDSALFPLIKRRQHSFPNLLQSIERDRLKQLVHACLEWEKTRPSFVIEALEQSYSLELAGVTFNVRVDRLDVDSHGNKWVIDYKSTLPSPKPWHEERPEASQLLLYALLDSSINTLAFIQLKAGQVTCSGFSENTDSIIGITYLKQTEAWSGYQAQWNERLTRLAQEYISGHTAPTPAQKSTCQPCEFKDLCRVSL